MDGLNLVPATQATNQLNNGSWEALNEELFYCSNTAPASATWPTANLAIAIPLYVSAPGYVQQFWWANGAAVSGHVQMALCDEFFNVIAQTPSTVPAGTSAPQSVTISSPVLVVPGRYYLVLSCDNTTQTFLAWLAAAAVTNINRSLGIAEQATAFPIPTPVVPASSARSYVPLCGVSFGTQAL